MLSRLSAWGFHTGVEPSTFPRKQRSAIGCLILEQVTRPFTTNANTSNIRPQPAQAMIAGPTRAAAATASSHSHLRTTSLSYRLLLDRVHRRFSTRACKELHTDSNSSMAGVANGQAQHHQQQQHTTIDSDFLRLDSVPADHKLQPLTCLVLLNFGLPKATAKLWQHASYTVCADGGTNRLYDGLPLMLGLSESEASTARSQFLPQAIIGDLDSIRPEVRSFYLGHGVPVVDLSHDQDTTDLMKCLAHLEEQVLRRSIDDPSSEAVGASHSQLDDTNGDHSAQDTAVQQATAASLAATAAAEAVQQAAASASSLPSGAQHAAADAAAGAAQAAVLAAAAASAAADAATAAAKAAAAAAAALSASTAPAADGPMPSLLPHRIIVLGALGGRLDHTLSNLNALYQYPHLNIVLWGEGNLVRLLKKGTTLIQPARGREGPACGLVPLGGPAIATSTGLKWNLDKTLMQVSGLLSTCNVLESDEVWVTSDRELLWMTEVEDAQV